APVASFTYSVNCNNTLTVSFTNDSKLDTHHGNNVFYWDFGDGTTSDLEHPGSHTYSASKQYTVRLRVSNDSCTTVYEKEIALFSPNADFSLPATALCRNTMLAFTPVEDTARIASYRWSVDGTEVR